MIEPDRSVLICFLTWTCIRAVRAVFTLADFFLAPVLVALYVSTVLKMKGFSCWAAQGSFVIDLEIYGSEWVVAILFVRRFFFEHGKFHVFLHAMLFTVDVVVI